MSSKISQQLEVMLLKPHEFVLPVKSKPRTDTFNC